MNDYSREGFCEHCGAYFIKKNPNQKFDKPSCRKRNHHTKRRYFPNYHEQTDERYCLRQVKKSVTNLNKIIKTMEVK